MLHSESDLSMACLGGLLEELHCQLNEDFEHLKLHLLTLLQVKLLQQRLKVGLEVLTDFLELLQEEVSVSLKIEVLVEFLEEAVLH